VTAAANDTTTADDRLDQDVVAAAAAVEEAMRADLMRLAGQEAAVVAAAPAGAGKSHFVAATVGQLRAEGLRVALAAPTNDQVQSLVERVKQLNPDLPVAFVHGQGRELPPHIAALPGVTQPSAADAQTHQDPLVIATVDKLADAFLRNGLGGFDVLVIDEAYQADAARYYTAAGVAATHLLVGDTGQLDPFSPIDDATYWRGGPEDPLQTAVGVLLRNHPGTPVHQIPVTWRLEPRAVPVARCFYPGHAFSAAVRPGVRELRLTRPGPGSQPLAAIDAALDEAARHGWAHVTLPGAPVLTADPTTAVIIRELVHRLLARSAQVRCENRAGFTPLRPADIAVGVSHNDQKDLMRALLDSYGLPGVRVDTANRLQGLTFEVVVAWHPLAGAAVTDAFHLDPGRLCVLLTRHRQACIVVGRDTDMALLEGVPPATPGFLGWDPDPILDGWDAHEGVFRLLEPHVIPA
jgi:AAA domain